MFMKDGRSGAYDSPRKLKSIALILLKKKNGIDEEKYTSKWIFKIYTYL